MSELIRVLIVDDSLTSVTKLKQLLAADPEFHVVGETGMASEAVGLAEKLAPHVVIVDAAVGGSAGIDVVQRLALNVSHCPVIVMSDGVDLEKVRAATQAGARDILGKPPTTEELYKSICNIYKLEKAKGTYTNATPMPEDLVVSQPRRAQGRIVTVVSGKGGSGRTLLSVNLAAALQRNSGVRVCVVDLDLQFGDVGVNTSIQHDKTIAKLMEEGGLFDWTLLEDVLADGPSGVKVLLCPFSPEDADLIHHDTVQMILTMLSDHFDFVIVDTASYLSDATLGAIDSADHILLLTTFNFAAIKDTRVILNTLGSLKVPIEKVKLVVSDYDAHSPTDEHSVIRAFRIEPWGRLPEDKRAVIASIKQAKPFTLHDPSALISKAVINMANKLLPGEPVKEAPARQPEEPGVDHRRARYGLRR